MFSFNVYSYNTDVAKTFGVCSAVFITYLAAEQTKQQINDSENLVVSRDEIYAITALDYDKQSEIEKALVDCGVIAVKSFRGNKNKNYYVIDFNRLQYLMNSSVNPLEEYVEGCGPVEFKKKKKTDKRGLTKQQQHINNLKTKFSSYDPILQQYLCDWVDAVYDNPKGFITAGGLRISLNELSNNSETTDEAIEILKIAIKGGMRDLTWAIERYKENKKQVDLNNFSCYNDIKSDGQNTVDEAF